MFLHLFCQNYYNNNLGVIFKSETNALAVLYKTRTCNDTLIMQCSLRFSSILDHVAMYFGTCILVCVF